MTIREIVGYSLQLLHGDTGIVRQDAVTRNLGSSHASSVTKAEELGDNWAHNLSVDNGAGWQVLFHGLGSIDSLRQKAHMVHLVWNHVDQLGVVLFQDVVDQRNLIFFDLKKTIVKVNI